MPENEVVVLRNLVRIEKNGRFIYVKWLEGAEIDADLKLEMHLEYLRLSGGRRMLFLFEAEGGVSFTREAREKARELEPQQPFTAVAMYARSLAFRMMCDFYQRFYKPIHPYKVFSTRESALEWLSKFGEENAG